MRILLADDQMEVRTGLKVILEQQTGIDIVGEAEELGSLLIKTKENNPDVILLDWELSQLRVSDVIPMLRLLCPGLKVIALSGRPEALKSALASGVDAFVSKGDQPERLLDAIKNLGNK